MRLPRINLAWLRRRRAKAQRTATRAVKKAVKKKKGGDPK